MKLTRSEARYFREEVALHEAKYLAGANPRAQSGFGRDAHDWERFRRVVVAPVEHPGTFLDIGCANGLLMESVAAWTAARGLRVDPFGLDISYKLAELARQRVPHWRHRIFVGNALTWDPPMRFDFVRTELVYVPATRRGEYVDRLLTRGVAPGGRLIVCSYGSSRPEGARAALLVDELSALGHRIHRVDDVTSEEHGFVITRAVTLVASPGAGASS
jgi:SAM-dependent methyltransferase